MPVDVIMLSDSDSEGGRTSPDLHMTLDNFDVDLPPVNFYYENPKNCAVENHEVSPEGSPCKKRKVDKTPQRRLDKSSESSLSASQEKSSDKSSTKTSEKDNESPEPCPKKRPVRKITEGKKTAADMGKRKEEVQEKRRLKYREEQLKNIEKLNKQSLDKDVLLRNCRALIDQGLRDLDYLEAIASQMHEKKCVFHVEKNEVPFSITWKRMSLRHFLEDDMVKKSKTVVNEDQMLVIWDRRNVVDMIQSGNFKKTVEVLQNSRKEHVTLLIVASGRNGDKNVSEFSKAEMEEQLVEIQVLYNCTALMVESVEEMATIVCQFTKGIAMIPLKNERWQKLENVETYITGEKRKLVAVNKEGYGLKQLWQKQLCQFNLCSWEIAEVISMKYPSPSQLMKAYEECSDDEGEMLLANIPVRRAPGPMSCARKIGPELSKKIYTMFTSTDGDQFLDNISEK